MTNLQHTTTNDGLGLIYLKDSGVAGINLNGLARMLGCEVTTVRNACNQECSEEDVMEVQMPTSGGVQWVYFILESGLIKTLKTIRTGKFKAETKLAADNLYDRFAMAGFKLYAMLKVAPEVLQSMIPPSSIPDFTTELNPIDAQIQRAIALAGGGGALAIEAFKLIHGINTSPTAATPASPEPKPTKNTKAIPTPPPTLSKAEQESEARELVQGFMRDIQTLVDAGILGPWDVSSINQNFKPCTAIVIQRVIPLLNAHFSYQIDRVRLEAAIVTIGGKRGQNQRFEPESSAKRNGQQRTIVRKCIVIPDAMI